MKNNREEPQFMKQIWTEVEQELMKEQETAACELNKYLCHRVQADRDETWSCDVVAKNLVILHESLIEWAGMMDLDMLVMLHLITSAEVCFVRVDELTGEYKSALYVLACEDGIVVMADTEDAVIMAGTCDGLIAHTKLPYVNMIQSKTKEYFDCARSIRQLESIIAPTGEKAMVLFEC